MAWGALHILTDRAECAAGNSPRAFLVGSSAVSGPSGCGAEGLLSAMRCICPNVQRAFVCARMAKEKAPYWRRGSRLYRSSYPEAKRVEADIGMAPFADARADELALVAPGTAANHTKVWIATAEPR